MFSENGMRVGDARSGHFGTKDDARRIAIGRSIGTRCIQEMERYHDFDSAENHVGLAVTRAQSHGPLFVDITEYTLLYLRMKSLNPLPKNKEKHLPMLKVMFYVGYVSSIPTTWCIKHSFHVCSEVVEHACSIPTLQMGEFMENVSAHMDTYTLRQPLGVTAGICPFVRRHCDYSIL